MTSRGVKLFSVFHEQWSFGMSQGAISKCLGRLVEAERRVHQSWWCFMSTKSFPEFSDSSERLSRFWLHLVTCLCMTGYDPGGWHASSFRSFDVSMWFASQNHGPMDGLNVCWILKSGELRKFTVHQSDGEMAKKNIASYISSSNLEIFVSHLRYDLEKTQQGYVLFETEPWNSALESNFICHSPLMTWNHPKCWQKVKSIRHNISVFRNLYDTGSYRYLKTVAMSNHKHSSTWKCQSPNAKTWGEGATAPSPDNSNSLT